MQNDVLVTLLRCLRTLSKKYAAIQNNPDRKMDEKFYAYCMDLGLQELVDSLVNAGVDLEKAGEILKEMDRNNDNQES